MDFLSLFEGSVCVCIHECMFSVKLRLVSGLLGHLLATLSETVLETSVDLFQVSHSAGSLRSSSLGLLTPVVASHLLGRETARRASLLLLVIRDLAASSASSVSVRVSFSEGSCTFGHSAWIKRRMGPKILK